MAKQITLEIATREVKGKSTKHLRKVGKIPANIYGHNQPSEAVQVDALNLERLRREHGTRHILSLHLPGATAQTALIRHVQYHPITRRILHVDFFRVSMNERLSVKVPLRFVGESLAVKIEKGVLLHLLEALEVECKASEIVEALEIDVTTITSFDTPLHASDVPLPKGYKLITDPAEPIAKVAPPRAEAVEEVAEEAAEEEKVATPEAGAPETVTVASEVE